MRGCAGSQRSLPDSGHSGTLLGAEPSLAAWTDLPDILVWPSLLGYFLTAHPWATRSPCGILMTFPPNPVYAGSP